MGIAKYFSKDLLAINQVLKNSNKNLEGILLKTKVGIAFDTNAIETNEGIKALDLAVRLLARLYPNINIFDVSGKHETEIKRLQQLAKSINASITLSSEVANLDVMLVAGETKLIPKTSGRILFFGSDNWNSKFSLNNIQRFQDTDNPFGCGVAACIAVSNTFRFLFKEFIADKVLDDELNFSTLYFSNSNTDHNPELRSTELKDVVLVGIGAIGNGAIWALSNIPMLEGRLDIVDNEEVALSNLQRYVLFDEKDIEKSKVESAQKSFTKAKLKVTPFHTSWAGYLKERNNWKIETVAVAIDNKRDRIGIQSALPRQIVNAYTESNLLGIARHTDFVNSACLACGYIPLQKEKNYINEVADNCNIPTLSNLVKDYINLNLGVETVIFPQNTSSLLDVVAQANGIPREQLTQFHGKKINQFYSEFVCGGISLSMSTVENKTNNLDAPLAFQSAMAGILLAAELVIDAGDLRQNAIAQQSHIYPLNPMGKLNPYNHRLSKDTSGRCLCGDTDFQNQSLMKWK